MAGETLLNSAIEMHDSELAAVERDGPRLKIHLTPAYIHKSPGRPAIDPGSGWTQNLTLQIEEGTVEGTIPEMPCVLSDGTLTIGEIQWNNCIPLPVQGVGNVELILKIMWGGEVSFTGKRIFSVLVGEPRYVEEFPGTIKGNQGVQQKQQ